MFFRYESAKKKYDEACGILKKAMIDNSKTFEDSVKVIEFCARHIAYLANDLPDIIELEFSSDEGEV